MKLLTRNTVLSSVDITESVHTDKATILLNQPLAPDLDKLMDYLSGVNERAWYTNFGELHELLTERLSHYLGVKNLLLVNNGTTALQVASKVLGGKQAWTTPYSFAATSSALAWQGIPVDYSDVEEKTFSPNIKLMENLVDSNPSIDMIVPTHIYGSPCNIDEIDELAKSRNIKVLYDAAQSFGVNYEGKSVLSYGDASIISFHATKVFHTVEGGAICFKNNEDFLLAKQMINFGFNGAQLGPAGINGKLNEYQAAVGLTLLENMDDVLSHRINLFQRYQSNLSGHIQLQKWSPKSTYNGGYLPVVLPTGLQCQRLISILNRYGIQSRIYFKEALHRIYGRGESCAITDSLVPRVLTLPLHYHLSLNDVDKISEIITQNV
ncbi:DegT/DnrJ/EryC1/StrS family aminotransferase [Paraglaciecola chathamensis]|uniref:DegT/DnrJ/EryC1/StrS family aminotransferase n=1 Tax=Paraglaciecola chathamensis TaxID=368405 RepID=UPI0026F82740|nr:DegT/DnrJ/EryC1/StrS family aminotransferase [Paraglaciecola chathamensis]MDO6558198.1 DegT/DnrJ/EryC1/StrS family aminotransferase [Paraglaciecola chathamensis]